MKKTILFGIFYLSIVLNIILFLLVFTAKERKDNENGISQFPFLSPRIFAEKQNDLIVNFVPLRESLNSYLKDKPKTGIYFEYLPSGVSIGINDKQNFITASLLKIPLAMGVFKEIEKGRMKESDILTVDKDDLDPGYGTFWNKGEGAKITVRQALELSVQQSDNTASNLLLHNIASGDLQNVFDYLDIPKDLESQSPVVTPKNYSSILRSLYLSSYLSPTYSNKLLDIMNNSVHNDKIRAPIPKDIKVAHKIGVHESDNPEESVYTDCGIVYVPKRPYILCIMTKDTSEKEATEVMNIISDLIYQYVISANHQNK